MKPTYNQLLEMLIEARDHLEYCGYGDAWERGCAREDRLPERLDDIIHRAGGYGSTDIGDEAEEVTHV